MGNFISKTQSTVTIYSVYGNGAYRDDAMKKVGAFVTVEYALLLPVILIVYSFLIYISIYQYDACLLQNDAYFYALEGEHMPYVNKYMWMEGVEIELPKVEASRRSPENILRICKRLQDES